MKLASIIYLTHQGLEPARPPTGGCAATTYGRLIDLILGDRPPAD